MDDFDVEIGLNEGEEWNFEKINDVENFAKTERMKEKILHIINNHSGTNENLAKKIIIAIKKEDSVEELRKTYFGTGNHKLYKEHHREGSERLKTILLSKGFENCGVGDAESLWMLYSDSLAAGFLGMPDTYEEIYNCVKEYLCVEDKKYIG